MALIIEHRHMINLFHVLKPLS